MVKKAFKSLAQLLAALFVCGAVLFFLTAERDDLLMSQFKEKMAAFVNSGKEKALLKEVFQGSPFLGKRICMMYSPASSGQTVKDSLKVQFANREDEIEKLASKDKKPSLLIVVETEDGLLTMMGVRKLTARSGEYTLAVKQPKYGDRGYSNRCFSFDKAFINVQGPKRIIEDSLPVKDYVELSD